MQFNTKNLDIGINYLPYIMKCLQKIAEGLVKDFLLTSTSTMKKKPYMIMKSTECDYSLNYSYHQSQISVQTKFTLYPMQFMCLEVMMMIITKLRLQHYIPVLLLQRKNVTLNHENMGLGLVLVTTHRFALRARSIKCYALEVLFLYSSATHYF